MRTKNMFKRIMGLLLSLILAVGLVSAPIETKADAPRHPQAGDTFVDYDGTNITSSCTLVSVTIPKSSAYWEDWTNDLTVYGVVYNDKVCTIHYVPDHNYWALDEYSRFDIPSGSNAQATLSDEYVNYSFSNIDSEISRNYAFFWGSVSSPLSPELPSNTPDKVAKVLAPPHIHSWSYGIITNATENTDGLEGEFCKCGATRNTSVIPAGDVIIANNYAKIDTAKSGQNIVLDMKTMCNLSQTFMKKLASKNSCSFTIRLKYLNKLYEFYVPAGASFDIDLEYFGPEKLMEMFEYKQL